MALSRAISQVENGNQAAEALLHQLHGSMGRARRIGITGPPGAGKSTLTAGLARQYRAANQTVAIIAVDPTSPFTGGALLGDRIRMNDLATDPGIFIRSMATRGSLGGLSNTSSEVADLLDAFGFDIIITETVGVGQSELEIAETADTTVVVLVPESGDSIQAMKAGLMEIADIFVVNKADRPGADRLAQELEIMLHLRLGDGAPAAAGHHGVSLRSVGKAAREKGREVAEESGTWAVPVLKTIAESEEGVPALAEALLSHAGYLKESGGLRQRRRRRIAERVRAVADREILRGAWDRSRGAALLERAMPALESGDESPYSVAHRIVRAADSKSEG